MTERVGQQLGNYRLLRVLGQGAFAAVYLGEHQYLERPAAIKVLHMRMEEAHQESFRREARTIAKLQHPHIIGVHDFGIEDQTPYLVMEYTPNGTLRSRHPKGTQVPFERIVLYVKQIASALDYAHAQHVIHRDIKPENILLNTKQEVILSDFGIAVVQQTLDSLSTQNPAGTPLYMAPEQIQRHPCPASDQYALGVMVYEWLCGEPPFRGPLYEVFSQHLHQPPPSLCERVPQLPLAVEDAVFGALAKDPGQRFASVADFATVLDEAFFATQPLSLQGSVVYGEQEESTRPLAPATTVPVSSSSEQESSDEATHPKLRAISRIKNEHEQVLSIVSQPVMHSQSASHPAKPPVAQTNRQRLLRRVRSFWIEGVLEHSLYGATLLTLGLETQSDAVANPWHLIVQHPDTAPHPLPTGTQITQVYDTTDGELLILGAPGSGKTTLLLELARELLTRAEQDERHPIPVIFSLSSWAMKQQPLTEWLVEELVSKYQVPRKIGQTLVNTEQILPLLDGLDEVASKSRTDCIEIINNYREVHGLQPLIVCSRSADYLAQTARVLLHSAVLVQPLSQEQVDGYLSSAGASVEALRMALRRDSDLQELATTPLMLTILMLAYRGTQLHEIVPLGTLPAKQQQVFAIYVQRMLTHGVTQTTYSFRQTIHWLTCLARQMKHHNQTVFYIEHLHSGWLSTKQLQQAYRGCAIQLPGMLIGMLVTLVLSPFLLSVRAGLDTIILGFIGGIAGRGLLSGSHPIRVRGERKIESSRSKRYHSITTENLKVGMRMGLIYGLCLSSIMLLITGLNNWLVFGKPIPAVTLGTVLLQVTVLFTEPTKFFLMVICIILVGRNRSIQPAEIVSWSWGSLWQSLIDARHVRNTLLIGLIVGLFNGIISGLFEGLVEGVTKHGLSIGLNTLWIEWNVELKSGLVTLLQTGLAIGLSYWLLLGLFSGISSNILDEQSRIVPNQGIRRSARNSLLFGLISGLVSGFAYTLIYIIPVLYTFRDDLSEPWMRVDLIGMLNSELIIVIAGGLLAGLLMGGLACLQHCILRFLLWRAGSIPWNYPYFLDYATERTLLRKVGGGYIFVHRLLLEYFASLDTMSPLDATRVHKEQGQRVP